MPPYTCPSCEQEVPGAEWIQVEVSQGAPRFEGGPTASFFVSRDRYHLACWTAMSDQAYADAMKEN